MPIQTVRSQKILHTVILSEFSSHPEKARRGPYNMSWTSIGYHLRGLRAVKETSASEQLVSIPVKATVTLRASESSPFKSWVSREFWDRYDLVYLIFLKSILLASYGPTDGHSAFSASCCGLDGASIRVCSVAIRRIVMVRRTGPTSHHWTHPKSINQS